MNTNGTVKEEPSPTSESLRTGDKERTPPQQHAPPPPPPERNNDKEKEKERDKSGGNFLVTLTSKLVQHNFFYPFKSKV